MTTLEQLQILLHHHLTPKGRRLINDAIKLLEADDPRSSTKIAEIDQWWKLTFADVNSFASLQANMFILQDFVLKVLTEDYLGLPYKPPQYIEDMSRVVAAEQKTGPQPLGNVTIRMPLEQLEMNSSHVTKRLLRVHEGHKAENTMAFLKASHDTRDQETLAEFLAADSEILDRLHEQKAIQELLFEKLKKAMEKVRTGDGGEPENSWHSWIQTQGERLFSGASKSAGEPPRHTPGHLDSKSR